MEFEYTGTIYFDIDYMVKCFIRDEWDDLEDFVNDYIAGLDDCDYYNVEGWMVDKLRNKMMEYEEVKLRIQGD